MEICDTKKGPSLARPPTGSASSVTLVGAHRGAAANFGWDGRMGNGARVTKVRLLLSVSGAARNGSSEWRMHPI
jgi:hypothetical protein